MVLRQNLILEGKHGKPILVDLFYNDDQSVKPIVIFSHGFKGFKDFGHFNLIAKAFANAGFYFVKFSFSHNGTTPESTQDFVDLEAFSDNNFSKELDDLGSVINWLHIKDPNLDSRNFDLEKIYLIGHSRGGGITILKANEDPRIKRIATWASVNIWGRFWSQEAMDQWKQDGVMYVLNGRTRQQMPMKYQVYEDYYANKQRLYIPDAVKNLQIPFLAAHGTDDPAVSYTMAEEMKQWNDGIELFLIEGANHVFGGKHPWTEPDLPEHTKTLVDKTIGFFS